MDKTTDTPANTASLTGADWGIIIYKFISGLVSLFVGVAFLGLMDENLTAIGESIGSALGVNPDNPLVSAIATLVSSVTSQELAALAIISLSLGVLSVAGAIGMWMHKDWGDILIIITLAIFIPIEVMSLLSGFSIVTLIIFILDVTILVYLINKYIRKKQAKSVPAAQT